MKYKCAEQTVRNAVFVALGVAITADAAVAGFVERGRSVTVSGPDNVADFWVLLPGSGLVLRDGAKADYLEIQGSRLSAYDAFITTNERSGIVLDGLQAPSVAEVNRTVVHSSVGAGVALHGGGSAGERTAMTLVDSEASGFLAGAAISRNGTLELRRSALTSTGANGTGLAIASGVALLLENSVVEGNLAGAVLGRFEGLRAGAASVSVSEGATIRSSTGPAVLVTGAGGADHVYELTVRDGGSIVGGNGVAVEVRDNVNFNFVVDHALVRGDIAVAKSSKSQIHVARDGRLEGAVNGSASMDVGRGATWVVTTDSHINNVHLNGGVLAFSPARRSPSVLRVDGSVDGIIGGITVNAHMDPSDVRKSWADSVLVEGDVDVQYPVDVAVNFTGAGHGTDVNGDGIASGTEGFSIIQVGGSSRPDAFRLRDGYVTHGAFQYELKAFRGNEVSAGSSLLERGPAQWDYRLAERVVCKAQCDDRGDDSRGDERPAVAPQIPSYLSTPAAVFAYTDGMSTSLHERLGEIRDHAFEGFVGGEMFARYFGRSQRYSSDRSFKSYGYDFDESVESWQFGGSIIGLDGDNGSLRAGLAIDHGRSTIVPRAVDGSSVTRLRANGTSAWITWRRGNGFWVDWVVGQERMRGQTDTSLGGRAVGRVKATSTGISFAAGLPFRLSHDWSVEPHVLVATQGLRFDPIREQSGLDVKFGRGRYVSKTAGMTLFRHNEVMAPFVRLDVRSTSGRGTIRAGTAADLNPVSFDGGRAGADYSLAGGLTTQLSARVQAFGEGSYRHYLGRGGFQGWSGNAGVRITF